MSSKEITLPEVTDKKPGKLFIIISYALALASLIAMLFVPLYNGKMAIQLVLAACDKMLSFLKISVPAFTYGDFFVEQTMRIYESAFILGIAGSTVLALIMLLPVILCKNPRGGKLRCAFAAEMIAFLAVTANVLWDVLKFSGTWENYAILIPFGVIMLVMAAQSIKFKGGLGVAKFIIFLLALATAVTLLDITLFIPALEEPLKSVAGLIGAYNSDVTFVGSMATGITNISELMRICLGRASFADPANIVAFAYQLIPMAIAVLVAGSVFLDVIGLAAGNKTKKNGKPNPHTAWFVVAAIRYSLIIVLIGTMVALSFLVEGFGKVGVYMYLTAALVLITFIVEIIRFCVGKAKVKAYNKEQDRLFKEEAIVLKDDTLVENETEETAETETQTNMFGDEQVVEAQPVEEVSAEEPAENSGEQLSFMDDESVEQEVEEPVDSIIASEEVAVEPVEDTVEEPAVVTQAEDNSFNLFGESQTAEEPESIDPFVDKLTDEERAQFFDIFINRNKGKFSSIPVYQLNGNNADFFPAVFVHINRMRNICSDSLLAKIYKEIGNE